MVARYLRHEPSILLHGFGGLTSCRQYRSSMNHIAAWARERGLMSYAGAECVPSSTSLFEAHLAGKTSRLAALQRRDG